MYSNTLQATQERVRKAAGVRAGKPGTRVRGSRDPDAGDAGPSQEQASLPEPAEDGASPSTSWSERLHDLPWKRLTGATVAVFVVAMGLILAFELTTGRAVSSYTGGSSKSTGTSVPGFDGRSDTSTDLDPEQQDELPQDTQLEDAPQERDEVPQNTQQEEQAPREVLPPDPAPQPAEPEE
ncbi:hypothetical protein [Ornithinimicrobium avium]|nr:hypothetical protein [Ornithinimicrobium avium]